MSHEEILKLVERISPQARDYVYEAYEDKNVEVLYSIISEKNIGVFIKVDNADCCIFFASFLNEDNIVEVLDVIKNKTIECISNINSKELCFNIQGSNLNIINLVRELGFMMDMEGYHLEYAGKELLPLDSCGLIEKGFESSMIKEFVDLFDGAYYQLNMDNGWDVNGHAAHEQQFHQKLIALDKNNQVRSFWLEDKLAGAYIIQQNYISDIVVKPIYQNKGYGSYILAHCIRNMRVNKSIDNIRLRVAKSNTGAKKLYERNGFVEIASFAEHTYSI